MPLRIVLVGAGSHVFGLSMLSQFLIENTFEEVELVLVDPDEKAGRRVEQVANRLRPGSSTWTADVSGALLGANYVICAAAVQMMSRFERDKEIIGRQASGHLISEFGGVYGAASTLRQLSLIEKICVEMRKSCPHARLFMISNPMPRLLAAARLWGIDAVGFCSVSLTAYNLVAELLGDETEGYPFRRLRSKYRLASGGTNHLAWLTHADLRETGANLMSELRSAWESTPKVTKSIAVARDVGSLPVSGDDHIQDFLPPIGLEQPLQHISHGTSEDREHLNDLLDRFIEGSVAWEEIVVPPSWERPGDVVRALEGGDSVLISSLNLPNHGQIPSLGTGAIVETPVLVDSEGFHPEPTLLSQKASEWSHHCEMVTTALVSAYQKKSLSDLRHALKIDPTVMNFDPAWMAIEEILDLDHDLIGKFS